MPIINVTIWRCQSCQPAVRCGPPSPRPSSRPVTGPLRWVKNDCPAVWLGVHSPTVCVVATYSMHLYEQEVPGNVLKQGSASEWKKTFRCFVLISEATRTKYEPLVLMNLSSVLRRRFTLCLFCGFFKWCWLADWLAGWLSWSCLVYMVGWGWDWILVHFIIHQI